MKKRYIIIMVAQTILILLMFAFAFVQKNVADTQRARTVAAQIEAEENFKEAERQRSIAEVNMIKAVEMEAALVKCNAEKKQLK